MLRKFSDWKTYQPHTILFTNVCTLMHNLQFAQHEHTWLFEHVADSQEDVFRNQSVLRLKCRVDNMHCKFYFLVEDVEFLVRRYYDADISLLDHKLQKTLWKQLVSDLVSTEQNIVVVHDVSTQIMSAGALKSTRLHVDTYFNLFLDGLRLRGLFKLDHQDVHKWYQLYQKYHQHVKTAELWQDIPLVFSVILGSTEFHVADFLYDRYQIREQDVIIIENSPPQGCVWIDIGGDLLLARYEQQKFILDEEVIMPEDQEVSSTQEQPKEVPEENQEQPQESPEPAADESQEQPPEDAAEPAADESQEQQSAESSETESQEQPQESSEPAADESQEQPQESPEPAADESQEQPPEDAAEPQDENDIDLQTQDQVNVKLPQVSTDKLSRTTLNTAIKKMSVRVVFELSRVQILLSELQKLNKGYVFNLHQKDNSGINIIVNDKIIAQGELVKISDSLGVRITKVF